VLHLGQARHLLGALGTLLLSAALRPPSPPSPVCDEAARAQEACRCPSAQTHRDAPGRPRAAAACGNCGGGPAENRGQRDFRVGEERVWQRALRALQAVSLRSWSEAVERLSQRHRRSPRGPAVPVALITYNVCASGGASEVAHATSEGPEWHRSQHSVLRRVGEDPSPWPMVGWRGGPDENRDLEP
jgi:hypothetical protein